MPAFDRDSSADRVVQVDSTGAVVGTTDNPGQVSLGPDAAEGALLVILATLSATPETPKVVSLPDWARGYRLTPSSDVRFAVGEDPDPLATHTAGDNIIGTADFGVGNVAVASQQEVRSLAEGETRTLRLVSDTASPTVLIEVF